MISSKCLVLLGLFCVIGTSLAAPQGIIGQILDPLGVLGLNRQQSNSDASAHSHASSLTGGIHIGPIGISGTLSQAQANANAQANNRGYGHPHYPQHQYVHGDAAANAGADYNGIAYANADANAQANDYNNNYPEYNPYHNNYHPYDGYW